MSSKTFTSLLLKAGIAAAILSLASPASAQSVVNLAAGPSAVTMPDGTNVPMWGYSCLAGSTAGCAALNVTSPGGWSPVVITVPFDPVLGASLTVNLSNQLSFATATGTNTVPTSLVIVGQLGGGLGDTAQRTTTPSPVHPAQGATWPIVGDSTGSVFTPPQQGPRVQSFATEVPFNATTPLTWTGLRPGTYLLESGTHPSIQGPMGLYGIIIVTTPPANGQPGNAYGTVGTPGAVPYGAEVPVLFSEIDPSQNAAVDAAVHTDGFKEASTKSLTVGLADTVSGVNVTGGGSGYTAVPNVTLTGGGTPAVPASAVATLAAGKVVSIQITNPGSGYTSAPSVAIDPPPSGVTATATATLSSSSAGCTGGAAACYPPAVNYTPLYYLVNGVAFDRTNPGLSLFNTVPASGVTGNVLVRLVNAGLRMHVPSIVGSFTTPLVVPKGTVAAAVPGFSLVAEDGNPVPGASRVQSVVFMAAGKTTDVLVNTPAAPSALAIYDRELSLSGNSINRDGGMLAYLGVNGGLPPKTAATVAASAVNDNYPVVIAGRTVSITDPSKGVIANDVNVFGVALLDPATAGTVTLNRDGTFTYVADNAGTPATFTYCANGTVTGTTCSSSVTATVTLAASNVADAGVVCANQQFSGNVATFLAAKPPGVLAGCTDGAKLGMSVILTSVTPSAGLTLVPDASGGFAASVAAAGTYSFTFQAQSSLGKVSNTATVTLTFPVGNGPTVAVVDGADHHTPITDYRWIIEEDRTFYVDPACTQNPPPAGCPTVTNLINPSLATPLVFGTNFHTSNMPVIATGCTGPLSCESGQTLGGQFAVCDIGNGLCRTDGTQQVAVDPRSVHLDPTKRYYISVLPGDSANPFVAGYAGAPDCSPAGVAAGSCGHGMGGAPIAKGQTSVLVLTQPSPYPPAKLSVFVFEDDFPLNGEHDAGGGVDVISPQEPGLGGFQITLFDDAGGTGDATGQPTYDMFNMPLTNSLAGTIDPTTGLDACPISPVVSANTEQGGQGVANATPDQCAVDPTLKGCQKGIVGMIVTCPTYESDGTTLSPLAGQAIVPNLYQGRYGVVATPGADRIARGEEWLQTNTLDGQKAHDSFMRIGEPGFFQEFGPAGYHVTIGFANPKIINTRRTNPQGTGMCDPAPNGGGLVCNNTVTAMVTMARMSRPPDERLYGSGTRDAYGFTQCYASLGDPDGADFAFVKCDDSGVFTFTGIPAGNWKITIFDQWNDQIVDGIMQSVGLGCSSTGAGLCPPGSATGATTYNFGEIAAHQWQANIYTRTFFDANNDGVSNHDTSGVPCTAPNVPAGCNPNYGNDVETGLALVATNIRFRDGSFSNFNNTDLNGYAGFNEVFPLFSWYTIETDSTRYKTTGVHVVYDTGGPVDGSSPGGVSCADPSSASTCGTSTIAQNFANTYEGTPLPADLSVPGSVYCTNADCTGFSIANGPLRSSTSNHSSGRIDPPFWFGSYGWQGFAGQNSFLEFGKKPFNPGETGGIHGHVIYASTRPFDDPQLLLQLSWEPLVPHVKLNLYKEDLAADGVTQTLTLIDTTETTSYDDWAQGFHTAVDGITRIPNMNCPGQTTGDLFYYSILGQPQWLDFYNHGSAVTPLPYGSQFKCYDGMHNWNQLQPAPYDGIYAFPSVTGLDPATGKPTGTNCHMSSQAEPWGCVPNPSNGSNPSDPTYDPYRAGMPMLPPGKYVVEVVVPSGFELVKEEDKNILIGDNYIAPVTQQFGGLGSIYILPDQAEVGALYNANNPQNATQTLGRVSSLPSHEGDTGSDESFWPCVGAMRTVPDFISLYPGSAEVSPFAGATRPLCDRKEISLTDQTSALAKFYVFTSTHVASHYTGLITDDFTSEFDPFSPQFGEKFAPANLPVSVKDWTGNEVSRVYSDQFGAYNGLNYSTWEVNPPNPTGYGPTMMVVCMNDSGAGTPAPWWDATATGTATSVNPDPMFQSGYSQFCYELPFMPGQTGYFDTPVTPMNAFSEGYNHADCSYPDATPAVSTVTGDVAGPWVQNSGSLLTITAMSDQWIDNYGYSGPQSTVSPFNLKKVLRHFGFGAAAGTVALVGSDGVAHPLTNVAWGDMQITGRVPGNVPTCAVQQQVQYGGPASVGAQARCGQLVITTAAGKQSIDTVTVTIGGKQPTVLAAGQSIQSAIDAALPGDMIIVPKGIYNEMVIMWKPVRLQGVGAASTTIDANTQPAAKLLNPWRSQIGCLFGLTPDGRPNQSDTSCSASWAAASGGPNYPTMLVDRVPTEGILGWDTTLNGNLAEQLIEPSLMGAYEGAGITVLAKGVMIPANQGLAAWGTGAEAAFPAGSTLLDGTTNSTTGCGPNTRGGHNPYPGNFYCNPSSIDGLGVTDSSQGGGGIFVHGWAHNIQIANNRVWGNTGSLSGGITIGQGEHVDLPLAGDGTPIPPGSCEANTPISLVNPTNLGQPFCYNMRVNVHHNAVVSNASMGDELFSSTPAGAGGVTISNGSDYYQFTHNWVCGNLSTGDGGGVAHVGWSKNGLIQHNAILFNQSTNPTITTNGGGLLVMGAPDPDPACGANNDKDCVPNPSTIGPSDGTGLGLVIDANLLLGNAADSGSGGGLRLQNVNGSDVINFPNGQLSCPLDVIRTADNLNFNGLCAWNSVSVTNNIIANNVAGWDGAGVSLQDALNVNLVNNTIMSNDSTASSGVLFNSLFAPLASAPATNCTANNGSQSCPQVAGLVSVTNSPVLQSNLPPTNGGLAGLTCPSGHGTAGSCRYYSVPLLDNDVFWQNRSFYIGVGGFGPGAQNQQKLVTLFNSFTTTPAPSQPQADAATANGNGVIITGGTGACVPASYWDIGVRGDTGPSNHVAYHDPVFNTTNVLRLFPTWSFLTDAGDYGGANNSGSNPTVLSQYCNGSRVPPENGGLGWQVPPGTNETNALPTPVFQLSPAATVDEGNNWINIRWGPLAETNPSLKGADGNWGGGSPLGNYGPASGSPAIDYIGPGAGAAYLVAPSTDFYGNARKTGGSPRVTAGAVEVAGVTAAGSDSVAPSALTFFWTVGSASSPQTVTVTNTGTVPLTGGTFTFGGGAPQPFSRPGGAAGGTCGATLAAGAACTINVVFTPPAAGGPTFVRSLTVAYANAAPAGVTLTGTRVPMAVQPGSLTFTATHGTTSAGQALTVSNRTGGTRSLAFALAGPFTRATALQGGPGTCGASLANNATCTYRVVFNAPAATGVSNGSVTITTNGGFAVTNSPVSLTGTSQ